MIYAALLALALASQDPPSPVLWSLKVEPAAQALKPGDKLTAVLTAQMEDGWHLYSISQPPGGPKATRISMPTAQPFRLAGAIQAPKFHNGFDPNFNMEVEYYDELAVFRLPVTVAPDAKAGKHALRVEAYFQTCDDRQCLRPTTVPVETTVTVAAKAK